MGFSFDGRCYPDAASALHAFTLSVPKSDGSGIVYFSSAPTITAGGVITYTVQARAWTSDTLGARTGTVALQSCSDAGMGVVDLPFMVFVVALFFSWAFGFRIGGSLVR